LGKIRSERIKRIANELFERYGDQFTSNFDENKNIICSFLMIDSKKMRNKMTGYITGLVKSAQTVETKEEF
jgi:small subunit ribosomal protein S17e